MDNNHQYFLDLIFFFKKEINLFESIFKSLSNVFFLIFKVLFLIWDLFTEIY